MILTNNKAYQFFDLLLVMEKLKLQKIIDVLGTRGGVEEIYLHEYLYFHIVNSLSQDKSGQNNMGCQFSLKFSPRDPDRSSIPLFPANNSNIINSLNILSSDKLSQANFSVNMAIKRDAGLICDYDFFHDEYDRSLYFFKPSRFSYYLREFFDVLFAGSLSMSASSKLDEYATRSLVWKLINYSAEQMYDKIFSIARSKNTLDYFVDYKIADEVASFYGNLANRSYYQGCKMQRLLKTAAFHHIDHKQVVIPNVQDAWDNTLKVIGSSPRN